MSRYRDKGRFRAWAAFFLALVVLCFLLAVWTGDVRWSQTAAVLGIPTLILGLMAMP